jgi:molybdate transport system substrate-binding protein
VNRRVVLGAFGVASAALLCRCNTSEQRSTQPGATSAQASASTKTPRLLVVFAAASLRDVFGTLGTAFEAAQPGTSVRFNFAGSQELRTQLEHGAEADVFASADQHQMQSLRDAQRVEPFRIFARNEPVLAVSEPNARHIRTFSDLPRATRIVLGAPEVPIGRYSQQILERAAQKLGAGFRSEVEARVVSHELNVRQVLAKISLGEADAGIVYRSDLPRARAGVAMLTIPSELNVVAEYPIARVTGATQPELARAFIGLVLSPAGQTRLKEAGFSVDASTSDTP